MTGKELLYVEDVLGHEQFLKKCACNTSEKLQDAELKNYMKDLEKEHCDLFNSVKKLLG